MIKNPKTEIFHGDCMEYIKTLKNNSVDCIITDPPYFLDTLDNNWDTEQQENRKSNSHIKSLPMGMKFSKKQGKYLEEFILELSKKLYRVLKPGGFFLCFSSPRLYHNMVKGIEDGGFEIRDQIIWKYSISQVKAFKQDYIIDNDKIMSRLDKFLLKEKLRNYRTPQLKSEFEPICVAMKPIEGRFIDNMRKWGTGLMHLNDEGKVSSNVLYYSKPSKSEKLECNDHPTVKPLGLIKYLISLYCPENGVVLDPFMGSGTTAISSLDMGRSVKGSETQKKYIDIIMSRLKEKNY
jgi:site-specific DNA-methyltransferase (adenine-specific)